MRRCVFHIGALVAVLLVSSGCAREILARNIVQAPNRRGAPILDQFLKAAGMKKEVWLKDVYAQTWSVEGAQQGVRLRVAVVEPGLYNFKYNFEATPPSGSDRGGINLHFNIEGRKEPLPDKGTIVLLHGFGDAKESMLFWAMELAEKGYRAVLVDLRGHGESTGRRISFGANEVNDLVRVADSLHERKLIDDRVGVMGVSYGAALGVLWAAQDSRVGAMVLLEPYADARRAIPEFIRGAAGKQADRFKDEDFRWAEQRAAKLGSFSWNETVPLDRVSTLKTPILYVHGEADDWVLPRNSEELMARSPPGSKLMRIPSFFPKLEHVLMPFRLDLLAKNIESWFDDHLAAKPVENPTAPAVEKPTA